ncbi:MAG: NAD(P)/FAD-dependent oxidoreductase [Dehalococcoidia bacterium]|nr:NAD(P)/FAD-dependent oxidoreductase [Dehalococcoidia bacterium]
MDEARLAREIKGEIEEATGEKATVGVRDSVAILSGRFSSLQNVVEAGHIAARSGQIRGVVEEINYPGKVPVLLPQKVSGELEGRSFDVVIVGGGVIGLSIARELSRFNLSIAVLERHDDLGMDQTAHSNAMVHPAVVTEHGTLKWEMNYRGNPMWDEVAADLDVDFKRIGTLIVAEKPEEELLLPLVTEAALKQNDPMPRELERAELDEIEPGLAPNVRKGVLIWNAGIISVFDLVLAYAENAMSNGVHLFLNTSATGVSTENGRVRAVDTTRGTIRTRILVNAAGLYSDVIAALAGDRFFTIHPRKGETVIFDKTYQAARTVLASVSMAAERSQYTKGGGIIPTVDGNLQFGPTAKEVCDREDVATTPEGIQALLDRFGPVLQRLKPGYDPPDRGRIITQFAGCRAATYKEDFIIEPSRRVRGLVHAAGIQSPGLASAPAIAERVREIIVEEWRPAEKTLFEPKRKQPEHFRELTARERAELVRGNPLYGHIVCRCEQASEGEIVNAVQGRVPATSIDAVKRRTRAGMGRCQGGFCMPRVLEIISREAGINRERVTKCGGESFILKQKTRED